MSTLCPICGSNALETTTNKHSLTVIYGKQAEYDEVVNSCPDCGESGDFFNANDETINKLLKTSKTESVTNMLEYLADHNIKMSYMERSLELPARTMARWKAGECTSSSLALLRIIRTYPWILEVADEKFDKTVAQKQLLKEALEEFTNLLEPVIKERKINIFPEQNTMQYNVKFLSDISHYSPKALEPAFEQPIESA